MHGPKPEMPSRKFYVSHWNCLWLMLTYEIQENRAEVLIPVHRPQANVSQGFSATLPFSSTEHLINLQSHKFARIKLVSEGTSLRHRINQPERIFEPEFPVRVRN